MRDFFWKQIHISDESASLRWAISLFAVIALFPTFGSLVDVVLIGMALFSLNYWFFTDVEFTPLERLVSILVLVYLCISIFSPLLHANPLEGMLFGLSNSGLIMLVFLMPVLRYCNISRHRNLLVLSFPVAGIIMMIGLLIEAIVLPQISRAELLSGNSLVLAFLSGCTLMGCVVYGFVERKRRLVIFLAGFVFAVLMLFATGSRAPILIGLVLSLGYIAFAALRSRNVKVIYFFVVLLIASVLAGIAAKDLGVARYLADRTMKLINVISANEITGTQDKSIQQRLSYYQTGIEMVIEKPFFGHGRSNVMASAKRKVPDDVKHWYNKTHLHSGYLTEMAGTGVIGLFSLFSVIVIPIILSWKSGGTEFRFAVLFTMFFGLYGLTNISFYHDVMVMSFVSYCLLLYGLSNGHKLPQG